MNAVRTTLRSVTAVAALLTLSACATPSTSGPMNGMDHTTMNSSTSSPAEAGTDANDQDVMFAQMMIPHHEQAVEMSDLILAKTGIDPRVTTLAEEIKAAQAPEIETLSGWLDAWGADPMADMDHGMDGMMSDEDLATLEAATGDEASKLYLEQMIEHHEGAVAMAQQEVDGGQNSDSTDLAQNIVDSQTAEIETMREILASL